MLPVPLIRLSKRVLLPGATLLVLLGAGAMNPAPAQTTGVDMLRALVSGGRPQPGGEISQPRSMLEQVRQPAEVSAATVPEMLGQLSEEDKAARRTMVANYYCGLGDDEDAGRRLRIETDLSAVEIDYCQRARRYLPQFGYDIFDSAGGGYRLTTGQLTDDYVLGVGDELVITLVGRDPGTFTTRVDPEGRLVHSRIGPVAAAGRRFGDFRRDLEARVAATLTGTQVYVAVGAVRLISVMVMGEVVRPGVQRVTSLSDVLDALSLAGGVTGTGSLRAIRLERNGSVRTIDLYGILLGRPGGQTLDLNEGDRILVPPLGPAMAVAGDVKRPGIFELSTKRAITLEEAMLFAGGGLRPSGLGHLRFGFDAEGRQRIDEMEDPAGVVADGDIIVVYAKKDAQLGSVELAGHVHVPGKRSLAAVTTARALIGEASNLKADPYLPFAVLETTDPELRSRRLVPISLQRVLSGAEDVPLRDNDVLIALSGDDVRYLMSTQVQNVLRGRKIGREVGEGGIFLSGEDVRRILTGDPVPGNEADSGPANQIKRSMNELQETTFAQRNLQATLSERVGEQSRRPERQFREPFGSREAAGDVCQGLVRLSRLVAEGQVARFRGGLRAVDPDARVSLSNFQPCPRIYDRFPDLLPFALEHAVAVNGEIRNPGAYPVAGNTTLAALAAVGGGATKDADLGQIEVTRYSQASATAKVEVERRIVALSASGGAIAVGPGDIVRFNPRYSDREIGPVTIRGEVVRPGSYDLRRGERFSDLIARAGGLTPQAYPYGTVFLRESVREVQRAGFRRAARELNSSLAIVSIQKGIDPASLVALQSFSAQLQNTETLGRVVIEADPAVLQVHRELDSVLEPGDSIFIPKRPNSIAVLGDVLNPGAQQFVSGNSVTDYIRQSGGFQKSADDERVFVVYPNGLARPVSTAVWKFDPLTVPPGSTIIVPKDATPFDLLALSRDFATIFSQLAIAAASISVISR